MNRPPLLTDEQRRQALIKAAEARRLRAEIKELLKYEFTCLYLLDNDIQGMDSFEFIEECKDLY